jgi:hypothetical protein
VLLRLAEPVRCVGAHCRHHRTLAHLVPTPQVVVADAPSSSVRGLPPARNRAATCGVALRCGFTWYVV